MENKNPQQLNTPVEQEENIVAKAKANSKIILGASIFLFVVVAAILAVFLFNQSGSRKADEQIARADMMAQQNDSTALALYKEAAQAGHKSGNRAKVEVAIRLYNDKKYEEALSYLKDADVDDKIVAAGVYSLMGDCYVNLKNYSEAIASYKKAVSKADKNPAIVPIILMKEATVYREEKNYNEEFDVLRTIVDEYPQFAQGSQTDIRKYYERAKAAAGK